MKGDCLIEMNKIADGSVDMILADLPYGTTACKWDNVIPFEPLWQHYWRVLKPNGAVVLFGSEPFSSHLRMSQIKHYKYDWVWLKSTGGGFQLANKQPLKRHEIISVFYKNHAAYYPQKTLGKPYTRQSGQPPSATYPNGQKHKTVSDGLRFPVSYQQYQNETGLHPTQKPVELLEYLIKTYTLEGETVLDNTMGSGSTGVAALNTNRKFIGIEQDDKYFEIAQQRISNAQIGE